MSSAAAVAVQSQPSGFFNQTDWEFELDTMADRSRESLEAHLAKAGADESPETVAFLRKYLIENSGAHFVPFED